MRNDISDGLFYWIILGGGKHDHFVTYIVALNIREDRQN